MLRRAAAVILVREPAREILLLRRHRGASFMSSSFVFPGGVAEADEDDLRATACRELFEEAGVTLTPDRLDYFARWITPSIEPRRYDATFYVAALPPGQTARPDGTETTEVVWVTPAEGLRRAGELRLPPPQVRTLHELAGIDDLAAACAARMAAPHPILPRLLSGADPLTLLLPWDPDYVRGTGDGLDMPAGHPLAVGPSRLMLTPDGWRHGRAGDATRSAPG